MKFKYLILLFFINSNYFSQKIETGFKKIPDSLYSKRKIVNKIIPNNKKYKSWEYIFKRLPNQENVVYHFGSHIFKNNQVIKEGFFTECAPAYDCFDYIKVFENKECKVINEISNFSEFLGFIDNLEEALLLVRTQEYWYDKEYEIGGAYKLTKKFIYLYVINNADYGMKYYKVKINRKSRIIEVEKEGKIEGKKTSPWVS